MNINATLLGQTISFLVFVWFCKKFVWPAMMKPIAERQKKIADGLAAAEKGQQAEEPAKKEAEKLVADAKSQAAEIVSSAEKRGSAVEEDAKTKAKAESERIITSAQAEIDQETNRARESLRQQVSTLAVAGASKIINKEIDDKAHDGLLEDLITQLKTK
jgi:F-type H+-transporting ATPase subunit b